MFKREIKRICAVIVILLFAGLALSLWQGWIKLSFLDPETALRDNETTADETEVIPDAAETSADTAAREDAPADETAAPDSEKHESEQSSANTRTLSKGDSIRYLMKNTRFDTSAFTFADADSMAGRQLSDAAYDSDSFELAAVTMPFRMSNQYSSGTKTVTTARLSQQSDDSETVVTYVDEKVARPTVELYMGYIIYNYNSTLYLLDSQGNTHFRFDGETYFPAYTRDSEDRALFYSLPDGGDKIYWYVGEDGKSFVRSDYSDVTDSRGLYFDYPEYYGDSDDGSSRLYANGLFAYQNAKGVRLAGYRFNTALNFSGGIAAVTDSSGNAYFIGTNGYSAFTYTSRYTNSSGRYVLSNLLPPLTDGIESLGFYYVDHGLVRVRERVIDDYSFTYLNGWVFVITDEDYLVYPNGKKFDLPTGYDLAGYSDGVALLQSQADGKYGYYSCTGAWVAQPIYTYAQPFVEGLAVLGFGSGSMGVIDTDGRIVIPFKYDSITNASSGVMACYSSAEGWTILNKLSNQDNP